MWLPSAQHLSLFQNLKLAEDPKKPGRVLRCCAWCAAKLPPVERPPLFPPAVGGIDLFQCWSSPREDEYEYNDKDKEKDKDKDKYKDNYNDKDNFFHRQLVALTSFNAGALPGAG